MTRGVQAGRVGAYGALPVPQMTPDLVRLIRSGEVYSLAVNFEEGRTMIHQVLGIRQASSGRSGMPATRRAWYRASSARALEGALAAYAEPDGGATR